MTIVYIFAAILVFGVLIAVHELGHFLAAKACHVQVNEFSVGMGPALWKKQKGETLYALRALPIGGYCAMEGEEESSENPRALRNQGFWKRLLIFVAGAGMNFLTGLLLILILYAGAQTFYTDVITGFAPEFALQGETGLMEGDVFYSVDGYRTYLSGDASLYLSYNDGKGVDLVVLREGEKVSLKDFPMHRKAYTDMEGEKFGLYVGRNPIEATVGSRLAYTWYTALDFVELVRFSLVQLVTGQASFDDVGGPVAIVATITKVGNDSATAAIAVQNILYLAALIAVNLAVMNLLPIPALDGGHILFLVIDTVALKLFGKKIPDRYEAAVSTVCLTLLMGFMLIITFHDVFKLFQ